nr:uncharacterized protein LOC105325318 [Crassostrea gigas]XP_034319418.1 uncharacterized protein LOC105325318 [Crassostrea gigas]
MDLELGQILDVKLIQSNEVRSSYWMEMEGLLRCLQKLKEEGVVISDLVTDRHPQIKAYMKKERTDINHWFDVWHVAKGIYKKLETVGKKKCELVGDWARSVSNHLYWCASSSDGDGELVSEKWLSVLNHITNVHEGHGQRFPKCLHGELEDRDWIKEGSLAFLEMEKVVKGKLLVNDIKKLSPAEQTSARESYHHVVFHFAPKALHFFYAPMKARLYIAALLFNENSYRDQAVNKNGEPIYSISYPKGRKGAVFQRK